MAQSKDRTTLEKAAPAEGYTVLARRYRPQTFAEIVGQEHIARALSNALASGRVAHAYLFTGNRGVGKTSTARILAKALNCEHGPTPTPCGTCGVCRGIAAGDDIDVLEIDGASNRGIDEIRDLRSNVQYRPSRARFKIYIIDEVHMLTAPAFNALLKTLEEPPPHVKFIFATTAVEKVPITILSRCQRFDFAGISLPRIVEHLREVLRREGREADDEALLRIARRAGGSMRDAQSLLDQLLAFGPERLTGEQVHELLGTAPDDRLIALAEAVLAHDPKMALALLDDVAGGGLQMGELLDQLAGYWRDLMVVRAGAGDLDLSVPDRHRETLARQAAVLSLDTILAGLDILTAARNQLRGTAHGRTIAEMALVRLGRLDNLVSLAQLGQWLSRQRGDAPRPAPPAANGPGRVLPPEVAVKKNDTVSPEPPAEPIRLTAETLPRAWAQTLANLTASGLGGRMLAKELDSVPPPAIAGPNTLVLAIPAAYNQARELFREPDRVKKVEDALRQTTGRPWMLRIESQAAPAPAEPVGPLPAATPAPAPPAGPEGAAPPRPARRNLREEAEKLPLIKRAIEVLGASVQRVDEGFGALGGVRPAPLDVPPDEEP
jgi:DNA polymerase-3 subunit gamma/tau